MTTIKASCPDCGSCELEPPDLSLMICVEASLSYYAFICPVCGDEVRKPADHHVISLLLSGGVQATVWELPGEFNENKSGPPLTYDDLLEFVLESGMTDFLSEEAK